MFVPVKDNVKKKRFPFITIIIVVVNICLFFLLEPDAGLMLIPSSFKTPGIKLVFSTFTSMFLHGSILHLAGNMLFLLIFGMGVEEKIGHTGFLMLYLLSGIFASLFYTAFNTESSIPVLGSSGAISGIMGAYTIYFFKKKILVVFPLPPFKAWIGVWIFILLWIGLQFMNLHSSGVAVLAHLGGFAFGLICSGAFRT